MKFKEFFSTKDPLLTNIKYLLLSLIFFSGVIFSARMLLKPDDFRIDTENIEKTLHSLETDMDNELSDFMAKVKNNEISYKNQDDTWLFEDFNNKELADKGFIIFAYSNNKLKYWSDNSITIPRIYSDTVFGKDITVKLQNAWFEIRKMKSDSVYAFGLIKLKNSFTYENQYLKNSFREDFDIPANVKISSIPVSLGINIKNKGNEYVFSLVPESNVITKKGIIGLTDLLFFLSIAFLLLYFNQLFIQISEKKLSILYLLLFSAVIIAARIWMINAKFPFFIYSLDFFLLDVYAGDHFNTYFGDLLINSAFILFFATNIYRIFDIEKFIEKLSKKSKLLLYSVSVLFPAFAILLLNYSNYLSLDLINNSSVNFEIHNLYEIDVYTVTGYVIVGILLSAVIFFTDKFIRFFSLHIKFSTASLLFALVIGTSFILSLLEVVNISNAETVFITILIFSVLIIRYFKSEYRFYTIILIIFFSSVFIISTVYDATQKRSEKRLKVLLPELEDVRDDIAELLLSEIDKRIHTDKVLQQKLQDVVVDHGLVIHKHLKRKYFYGFWEKYKLSVTLCGDVEYYRPNNQASNCAEHFNSKLKGALKLENSAFYFIDNQDGTISYIGGVSVPESVDSRKITVYIRLKEMLKNKMLGYPELLIDEENKSEDKFSGYSYAKYNNNELASKSGVFSYDLSDKRLRQNSEAGHFVHFDGYKHYVFEQDSSNLVVISKKLPLPVDYVISFAYLFVLFTILFVLAALFYNHKFILIKLKPDFNNKIQFSFYLILLLTFFLFGAGTVYYAVNQYKNVQNYEMSEKIQSVLTELEHKLSEEDELTPEWKSERYDHLDELLIKFSQVFFTDINLYDLNGFLLATSRPEIFKRGLIGKQINRNAFTELKLNKKAQFIQNENIGSLRYASVYIPFKNKNNITTAFINLPYFSNDLNLQQNISNLLITTVNIYVVLFLLTVVIAFVISTNITKPLRILKNKFKDIELGKKHQVIVYKKDDEIGDLIKEYNLMITELDKSAKKLADTQREIAWREMAKQIAHEIKNPLTPMKLSVQLLQRAWKDHQDNFEERLSRVSETLIEQIDTLSSIASEFSAFAKMPKAQNEVVNLISKLENVVQLFDNTKDTEVHLDIHNNYDTFIIADKEQLSRVFINIIKNGIQSIPEGIKGIIYVEVTRYGNNVKVTIEDNGTGIPEDKKDKLFKPSFTTKTKGMGMGLAIVKNIINNANGEIWFESEHGKGTKFFVEFPVVESPDEEIL